MKNIYVRDIVQGIQESKQTSIMVYKNKLTDEEMNLIGEIALEYKKTVIFASMKDVIFNNNENILVIE